MARQRRLTAEQGRAMLRIFRKLDTDNVIWGVVATLQTLNFDQASIDLITDLYDEG